MIKAEYNDKDLKVDTLMKSFEANQITRKASSLVSHPDKKRLPEIHVA